MTTYPGIRQSVGAYVVVPITFHFDSTDGAAAMGDLADQESTILAKEMFFGGWVWRAEVDAAGNVTGNDYLIHVAGSAVAASAFSVTGAAVGEKEYRPGAIAFSAGDALGVELDATGGNDENIVTLWVVLDISNEE